MKYLHINELPSDSSSNLDSALGSFDTSFTSSCGVGVMKFDRPKKRFLLNECILLYYIIG